MQNTKSHLFY